MTDLLLGLPLPPTLPPFSDGTICVDADGQSEVVLLGLDLGPDVIYDWTPDNDTDGDGIEEPVFNVVEAGVYSLQLFSRVDGVICGDGMVYTAQIEQQAAPTGIDVALELDGFKLFSGNQVVITATSSNGENDTFEYALDDVDGPWQLSNVFDDVEGGVHIAYVRNTAGCGTTLESEPFLIVNYPTFFSPNGDGSNDTWNILGTDVPNATADVKIYIYDRYGKLLRELNPLGPGWDGTYNLNDMPSSDYWFTVEYIDLLQGNTKVDFKGHFSLVR